MSDINQVKLRGRAGGDAEVKHLANSTLVTVRIATGESYTDWLLSRGNCERGRMTRAARSVM